SAPQGICVWILVIERSAINWFEAHASIDAFGPNIETIHRGVFGDRRDSPYCVVVVETPETSRTATEQFLRWPQMQEHIKAELFAGCATYSGEAVPLRVFRPVPSATSWQWRWHKDAAGYQQ